MFLPIHLFSWVIQAAAFMRTLGMIQKPQFSKQIIRYHKRRRSLLPLVSLPYQLPAGRKFSLRCLVVWNSYCILWNSTLTSQGNLKWCQPWVFRSPLLYSIRSTALADGVQVNTTKTHASQTPASSFVLVMYCQVQYYHKLTNFKH